MFRRFPNLMALLVSLVFVSPGLQALDVADKRFSTTLHLQPYSKLRQNAELGDAQAQFDLAYLYYKANVDPDIRGLVQSDKLAAHWYERAARQGHAGAQYNMAVLHLQGRGAERDPVAAFAWLTAAASRGHGGSINLLSELDTILNDKQTDTARQRATSLDPDF